MSLGLILPRETRRFFRCEVPGCGMTFPLERPDQFVRHCRDCSDRNSDRMEEIVARQESNHFQSISDKELYDHLARGGN